MSARDEGALAPGAAAGPLLAPAPVDVARTLRVGWWILLLGFGGFLLFAILVPLDEGVPAPATIVVENRSTQIQHPTGGVVTELAVHEGQRVTRGEVLLRLADVSARAGLDEVKGQWISLKAAEARLMAEQADRSSVKFPAELLALRDEPLARQQMALQEELFATRRRALTSELTAIGHQRSAIEASLGGARQSLAARRQQYALIERELVGVRQMVADGFTPQSRQSELERQAADLRAGLADLQGNEARLRESLAEVGYRQQQRRQEYRKEAEAMLADARRDAGTQAERMKTATEGQERTVLRAPIDGAVVGLAGANVGSVIAPGARIMEIVPDEARLVLEAQIAPQLIDRIQPGSPADIHLQAFVNLPQLVLKGRVVTVSASSLVDPTTHRAYYLARVEVTPEGLSQLAGRSLQPGMPADVVVKTGERSVLNYLLRPLLKRFAESLKEA
ncbi:MAG: HlyD family type I secretion periplasmic adaptor subunit [Ramlibacter sp.]|nr:HlyD family type I secretion periplasmic adaptor subunit [Ramlibacter sp.]